MLLGGPWRGRAARGRAWQARHAAARRNLPTRGANKNPLGPSLPRPARHIAPAKGRREERRWQGGRHGAAACRPAPKSGARCAAAACLFPLLLRGPAADREVRPPSSKTAPHWSERCDGACGGVKPAATGAARRGAGGGRWRSEQAPAAHLRLLLVVHLPVLQYNQEKREAVRGRVRAGRSTGTAHTLGCGAQCQWMVLTLTRGPHSSPPEC